MPDTIVQEGHAPGPWKIDARVGGESLGAAIVANTKEGAYVCRLVRSDEIAPYYKANAHLIAAGSELLSALEAIFGGTRENAIEEDGAWYIPPEMVTAARAAIAKARGQ